MLLQTPPSVPVQQFKIPGAPLDLDSSLYVPRGSLESCAAQALETVGSMLRIQAPKKMGKRSFVKRLVAHAQSLHYRIVTVDLRQADDCIFVNLDRFLRWFSANVSFQLGQSNQLRDCWDQELGSKVSCTYYFEEYILDGGDRPIVLVLNEMHRIFDYPDIAQDFLLLLRFWNEQAKQGEIFQQLRFVLVHSTEVDTPLKIHQALFNLGYPIRLPRFNVEQAQTLAQRFGLCSEQLKLEELDSLLAMVGGSPYRLSLAFYWMQTEGLSLASVLKQAVELGVALPHQAAGHEKSCLLY